MMESVRASRIVALLALVVAGVPLAVAQQGEVATAAANRVGAEQIQQWVDQLNADRYVQREIATELLVDAGAPAVGPVKEALRGSNLEVMTRGIYVLRELALCGDLETEEAARAALDELSNPGATALARRASATLAVLDDVREDRAVEALAALGANFTMPSADVGLLTTPGVTTLELGDGWHGDVSDLRRLKWLSEVQQVVLEGPKITEEFVEYASQMPNVSYLTIKRTKLTDDALAELRRLDKIQRLHVLYSPVSDAGIDHLAAVKSATDIRIYGTKITPMGADRLARALATTKIDYRRGAFLGVSCDIAGQNGCMVRYVHPGSAASEGGLQPGDVIVKYDDKNVADFDGLTSLIAEHTAGDTVTLELVRNGEPITKKVTFGEWE